MGYVCMYGCGVNYGVSMYVCMYGCGVNYMMYVCMYGCGVNYDMYVWLWSKRIVVSIVIGQMIISEF